MHELTGKDFNDVVGKGKVVVDFWAPWCAPCKLFAPTFEESSKGHPDVVFAKVNTEGERELAQQAGIRAIPTLIFFKDGKEVHRHSGALQKAAFEEKLKMVFG